MKKVLGLLALAGAATVANAQWTNATLTDGNAYFRVTNGTMPTSITAGASGFTADFRLGGSATTSTDHTFSHWWWVRGGTDTREYALALPSTAQQNAAVKTTTGTNEVSWSNLNPLSAGQLSNVRFTLTYKVIDLDGPGSLQGQVVSVLRATNIGSTTATGVSVFNYVDYFFTGEDSGDVVPAGDAGIDGSGNRFIKVSDPSDTGGFGSMYHQGVGASGYGVGAFSAVGGQVGDTGIDNFNDFNNATTAADQSGVMQWNFGDLAPGASAEAVSILTIPTPGALALVGMGGLIAARRRRA